MAYVYRFIDRYEKVIYVGYTGQTLDKRMSQHFHKGHLPSKCYNSISRIEYIKYPTKSDAMIVETYMINKYKPIYNKLNKQNDTITLDIEIDEKWKVYRTYNTTRKNDSESSCGCLVSFGVIAFLIYAIVQFLINVL